MIPLFLLVVFMVWAYKRGKRLQRKIRLMELCVAQLRKEEARDRQILRDALLDRTKAEWEIQKLEKRIDEIVRQMDEDIHKLLLNATEKDQVEYLRQTYSDEEDD